MVNNPQHEKIWRVIQRIPPGRVASYGQVADLAGLPGRARLAGKCLGYVPENGFEGHPVPWYRVLRSSGQIAFPPGSEHFVRQRTLLMEEGVVVKGSRVSLSQFQWQPSLDELLFSLDN